MYFDKKNLVLKIVKLVSQFSGAVAEKNLDLTNNLYLKLSKQPIDCSIMTVIHDILVNTKTNHWDIAKKDALALVTECADRYQDGYGLIAYHQIYKYHEPSEYTTNTNTLVHN